MVSNTRISPVLTDENGAYEISGLPPGRYILFAVKQGHSLAPYGSNGDAATTIALLVTAGGVKTNIDVQLLPAAFIAGTVFDASGQPVPSAVVYLFTIHGRTQERQASPKGAVLADAEGRYRMDSISPDTYFLAAAPPPGTSGTKTGAAPEQRQSVFAYYPGAGTLAQAIPITIRTGAPLNGIDIRLRDAVAHAITGAIPGGAGFRVNLLPTGKSIWSVMPFTSIPLASEQFQFNGVEPGPYELIALNGSGALYSRLHVDVGSNDLDGVRLTVETSPSVKGAIVAEGLKKISEEVLVELEPIETLPVWQTNDRSAPDGTFEIKCVVPGKYRVLITRLPEFALLKELRWGGKAVTDRAIDVGPDETRKLEAIVAFTGGSEGGMAIDNAGKAISRATVLTFPDGHGGPDEFYYELTGPSGTFLERNLPPGRYLAIALTDLDLRKVNRAFFAPFERYAQRIEVRTGQRTTVTLRVMPAQ